MKTLLKVTGLFVAMTLSTSASAYTINSASTDVGGLDTLIHQATLANSGKGELNWVQSLLGTNYSLDDKYEGGGLNPVLVDGETGIFAHGLTTSPEYFLIKIGGGNWGGSTHFLYENESNDNAAYGVFSLQDFTSTCTPTKKSRKSKCNIEINRVSHITAFNGSGVSSIPEPGSIALIGLGLLALGTAKRHRKHA